MGTRIGQQLGNYRLTRLLGRGGFAEVYLGEHLYLNTQAALKPPETIIDYVKQVAAALQCAHERNLIHRDIMPENMLLGAHREVLLGDFGLAVVAQSTQHQELEHIVGTIPYMAPEQLRGKPCKASDQYALGVVVYEWLCGALPFAGTSLEVAMQHLTAPVPPLPTKTLALSPAVEQVMLTALAKDPAQRFASITAFASALEQAISPERVNLAEHPILERHVPSNPLLYLGRQHQGPLVGRTQEWGRLRKLLLEIELCTQLPRTDPRPAALSWTTPSHPSCMMLLGEAGIGKTRLAEELSREAQQRGWAVIWSRGYAQESSIPYQLWIEFVRNTMKHSLWQPQEGKLSPLLSRSLPALTTLVPELADLLMQDVDTSMAAPVQEQLRLWEGILALMTTISERKPLLIVLDDLHWADGSSCELLSYLSLRLVGHRILFIRTCRERDLPSTHPLRTLLDALQQEQVLGMLHISPLSDGEISKLIAHVPTPLIQHIQRSAAGNPFFAEELARVFSAEGTSSSKAALPLLKKVSVALPQTITAILDLRLSKLSNACRRLLSRAAILGGSFEFNTIRIMEAGGADANEDSLLDLLEEALQTGILTEEVNGTHITYHFWHPLLVSHLYDGLSAGRCASLHRRAAEVLRQTYQGREQEGAATIVYHLVNGREESPQIARYAELAADHAYTLSAYPVAERHYRLAIAHGGPLLADASWEERLHLASLLERLGECTMNQGNFEHARHYYEQVLYVRSLQRSFDSQAEYQQEAQLQALFWCEIGYTWHYTGNKKQAHQCRERGEQVLREAGVEGGPAWASLYHQQGNICLQEGNYDQTFYAAQEALRLFEEMFSQQHAERSASPMTRLQRTLQGDPVDLGRMHKLLAAIATAVGQSTDAMNHLHTALTIFEHYDCQREIAMVCSNIGDVYVRRAEYTLAQAALHRSLNIAEQIGDIPSIAIDFSKLGILSARKGDLAEAEVYFKRALSLAEQVNDPVYMSLFHSYLTTILLDQGRMKDAKVSMCQSLTIGRTLNFTPCIGFALVTLGHLHIARALARQENNSSSSGTSKPHHYSSETHLLKRARISLQRALTFEGLEAEMRTEGQLALAQASLLLREIDIAQQQAIQAMEEARRYDQTWLLACAQRLMGDILSAKDQVEQADLQYEQALQKYRACSMRLEYARTLQRYGIMFLQRSTPEETKYQEGVSYLQKAREHFIVCQATIDIQMVEHILLAYCETSTQKKI